MTIGVFPVPPTVKFPTLITGFFNRRWRNFPLAYNLARIPTINPYTTESGHSSSRAIGGKFIVARPVVGRPVAVQ
jgi:hypothetical protein